MRTVSAVPPHRAVYKSISELGTPLYTEQPAGSDGVLYGVVPLYVQWLALSVMYCGTLWMGVSYCSLLSLCAGPPVLRMRTSLLHRREQSSNS